MGPCLVPMFEDYRPGVHGMLDPDVVVRPAVPSDAPGIGLVARTRRPLPSAFDEQVAVWAADEGQHVAVGARGDVVVGWGRVAPWRGHDDAPDGWYVSALTVHPEWRRRLVADRLLADLFAWTAGVADVLYSVVNAGNLASVEIHLRHGFREVARGAGFAGIGFTGGVGMLLVARTR